MRTRTVGELLKEERLRRRVKLDELSRRTRIRQEYLEALEANQFDQLPAATFVKGYIRSYSHVFDLDPAPLIALLRRDFKESAKGKLVPREFLKPVLKKRGQRSTVTLVLVVLFCLFASFLGYVGFQWYSLQQPPELTVTEPAEQAFVAAQVVVKGETEPDAIVSVNSTPVALQPDGSFETQIVLAREGTMTITIQAQDRRGKVNTVQRTIFVRN